MGGEGVPWVGQAPFTNEKHIFANLGDGTYFHSGLLAIRQRIASNGANITYKILYNDAVAMTGGQQVGERPIEVTRCCRSAGGVSKGRGIASKPTTPTSPIEARGVTPGRHACTTATMTASSRSCAEVAGVSVHHLRPDLRHREAPPAQARQSWRRPDKRVVINELVCEGCGDCSVQSNCLSVEPVETEFGRKRRIDQNTCNKDYSCTGGFCPFVTVEGGGCPRAGPQGRPVGTADPLSREPALPVSERAWGSSSPASAAPAW